MTLIILAAYVAVALAMFLWFGVPAWSRGESIRALAVFVWAWPVVILFLLVIRALGPLRENPGNAEEVQKSKIMEQPVNELGVALNSTRADLFDNTVRNWAKTEYSVSDAEITRLARFINGLTGAPEDKAELPDGFDYGQWDMDKAVEAARIALERPELLGEAVIKNNDYNEIVDFLLHRAEASDPV